jgi:hypothetical protein
MLSIFLVSRPIKACLIAVSRSKKVNSIRCVNLKLILYQNISINEIWESSHNFLWKTKPLGILLCMVESFWEGTIQSIVRFNSGKITRITQKRI